MRRLPFPHPSKAVSPGPSLPSPFLPDSLPTAGSISMIPTTVHSGMCSPLLANADGQEGVGSNDENGNNTKCLMEGVNKSWCF